jgi:hypothetical protein
VDVGHMKQIGFPPDQPAAFQINWWVREDDEWIDLPPEVLPVRRCA